MEDPFESTSIGNGGSASASLRVTTGGARSAGFPSPSTPIENLSSPRLITSDMSATTIRTRLQSLLEHKTAQLQMVGTMGQKVLAQQAELEERIQSLGSDIEMGGDEIDDDTQAKLLELQDAMKSWESDNQGMVLEIQAPKVGPVAWFEGDETRTEGRKTHVLTGLPVPPRIGSHDDTKDQRRLGVGVQHQPSYA
jgi:hypothetical protein